MIRGTAETRVATDVARAGPCTDGVPGQCFRAGIISYLNGLGPMCWLIFFFLRDLSPRDSDDRVRFVQEEGLRIIGPSRTRPVARHSDARTYAGVFVACTWLSCTPKGGQRGRMQDGLGRGVLDG